MTVRLDLGFGLLCVCCFVALRFQMGELLGRKNALGSVQKCYLTFFRAPGLHTIGLPPLDPGFLSRREIERRQIDARHGSRL